MAATATIDLTSYNTTAIDSTSSAKSCANNSNDFENIFNTVNKSYSDNNETNKQNISDDNNEKASKANDKKIENSGEKTQKINNNDDTDSNEKIDDKDCQKTSAKNTTDSPNDDIQEKNNNKNINDNVKKTSNTEDVKNNSENIQTDNNEQIKTDVTELIPKLETKTQSDSDTELMLEPQIQAQVQIQVQNPTIMLGNVPQTLPTKPNASTNDSSSLQIGQAQPKQVQSDSTQVLQPQLVKSPVNQAQTAQSQDIQNDLTTDLNDLQGNLDEIVPDEANNVKNQTQTQQELSNLKINTPNVSLKIQKTQKETQDLPIQQVSTEPVLSEDANSQMPVIEADTDLVMPKEDIGNTANIKQNSNGNLNKITINQEHLDKTNAKVISVENSGSQNSNSNNFSSRQNAQEQVAKMSVENNSINQNSIQKEIQNVDLINAGTITNSTDTVTQSNFAKTLDNVQAQQPKELSSTDILSQINKQLDFKHLQDEGTTKINIILKPENLGKINLELVNSKDGLTAKMTTDNMQVKELLDKSLNSLKDSLGNQGVNVSSVTVKVETTQKQSNDMFSFQHEQSSAGNQEFSNNAQNQNQKEFLFEGKSGNVMNEAEQNIETEEIISSDNSKGIENVVSFNSNSGRIDYKI